MDSNPNHTLWMDGGWQRPRSDRELGRRDGEWAWLYVRVNPVVPYEAIREAYVVVGMFDYGGLSPFDKTALLDFGVEHPQELWTPSGDLVRFILRFDTEAEAISFVKRWWGLPES